MTFLWESPVERKMRLLRSNCQLDVLCASDPSLIIAGKLMIGAFGKHG